MSRLPLAAAVLLFLAGTASTAEQNNTAVEENWCGSQAICGLHDDDGPWMSVLQQWALSAPEHGERQGRIMAIPAAQGYYVSERVEGMLAPPPAPHKTQNRPLPPGARPYDEWHAAPPTAGKIVNRPPNPYKDKFKPSYPAPVQNQPIPVHGHTVDRVDENRQPPQKQVSETDLYLLGAIEKLVWRADLFEKRLRKLEESIHLMAAGLEAKKEDEPCDENFMRVGEGCYHVSSDAQNWKGASYGCRRLKSNMLEIDSDKEKEQLANKLSSDKKYKGGDFWTGGLNPGLLWIWSHSARPVVSNATSATNILGEGRCLAWMGDAASKQREYRGHDCAIRLRYICEKEEDKTKLSNEIERVARSLRKGRKPKILWTDDES